MICPFPHPMEDYLEAGFISKLPRSQPHVHWVLHTGRLGIHTPSLWEGLTSTPQPHETTHLPCALLYQETAQNQASLYGQVQNHTQIAPLPRFLYFSLHLPYLISNSNSAEQIYHDIPSLFFSFKCSQEHWLSQSSQPACPSLLSSGTVLGCQIAFFSLISLFIFL